jgi:serine carboxypeptidase-like clade 4
MNYNKRHDYILGPQVNEELISYFKNQTGYDSMTNALESRASKKRNYFAQYLNTTIIRTKIHVGNQTLYNTSLPALKALKSDMFRSYKSDLEEVINKGLKVLIYVGQYDLQTPHVAVSSFVDSLNFTEKANFDKAPRIIVRDRKKGDVSGYVRSAENFAYVILRNAGHHAPRDQSRWSREMIERFVKDGDYSI